MVFLRASRAQVLLPPVLSTIPSPLRFGKRYDRGKAKQWAPLPKLGISVGRFKRGKNKTTKKTKKRPPLELGRKDPTPPQGPGGRVTVWGVRVAQLALR